MISGLPVYVYKDVKIIASGGIQIRDLRASQIPRRKPLGDPVLERYKFVPHVSLQSNPETSLLETIRLCIHLALENVQGIKVKVVEIGDVTVNPESILVAPYVASVLGDLPLIQVRSAIIHISYSKSKDVDIFLGGSICIVTSKQSESCRIRTWNHR